MTIYSKNQQEIAKKIQEAPALSNWKDWKWQLKHSIHDIDTLERLLGIQLPIGQREQCEATLATFPLAVKPYYLSLIDRNEFANDPVFRQSFPSPQELHIGRFDLEDPLSEDADSPVSGITHRYPDRVLFHISNICAMYCRHCTRKRKVGDVDSIPGREEINRGLDYIRNNPVVRDVLLSGGDPPGSRNRLLNSICRRALSSG